MKHRLSGLAAAAAMILAPPAAAQTFPINPIVLVAPYTAVRQAIADPELARKFTDTDVLLNPPAQMTTEFARKLLLSEIERWTGFIKKNNITAGTN